jgi:hypothetical protein
MITSASEGSFLFLLGGRLPSLRKSLRVFGLAFGFTGIGTGVDFLRSTGFGLDVGFIVISLLDERFVLLCE